MDQTGKETLLQRFGDFLDDLEDASSAESEEPAGNEQSDLYTLFVELAGLKSEVRIESRQFKKSQDHFRELFMALQADHAALQENAQRQHQSELAKIRRDTLRPLLLELLDLKDRMEAGQQAVISRGTSLLARFCKQERALLAGLREGQEMSARRLGQVLAAQQVRPLATVGHPLDPMRMRAVEIASRPDIAHGIVTDELRKGYLWQDQLLRAAEVTVNRLSTITSEVLNSDHNTMNVKD